MEINNYEIYYQNGLKQGVSMEEAIQNLVNLLKFSPQKAEKMIQATNRVIKRNLSKGQANNYSSVLDKIGMLIEIHEAQDQATNDPLKKVEPVSPTGAGDKAVSYNKDTPSNKRVFQLQFNGKGFEYFKIWIVNIFLTIVTLGIYSAWAKVRNKQYFYGNTEIDGSSFNYTASPIVILKGRLIAAALFVVYATVNQFYPLAGSLLFLVLMGFLPWIIVRSLSFNARNSVYRNIPFNFTGSAGDAVKVFLLWPLLILPTLGFILPFIWYKQSRFFVNNSAYGTTPLKIHATAKDYYKIFFILFGVLLIFAVIISVLAAAVGVNPGNTGMMMALIGPFSLILYLFMFAYLASSLSNLYFNTTTLADHSFTSQLKTKNIAWIYFTNTLAIAFSFGLLIPWAQVRMARYRVSCLQLNAQNSLNDFIAAEQKNISALGEQVGEVFDMDISIV